MSLHCALRGGRVAGSWEWMGWRNFGFRIPGIYALDRKGMNAACTVLVHVWREEYAQSLRNSSSSRGVTCTPLGCSSA